MNIIEEIKRLKIGIMDMANAIQIPCYDLSEMITGDIEMSYKTKEKIKIFLIENYTKRIEELLNNKEGKQK